MLQHAGCAAVKGKFRLACIAHNRSFVKLSHTLLVRTLLHSIIIRAVCPSTGIAFRRAAYTLALQRRSGQIVILQALTLGHVIKRLLDNKNICRQFFIVDVVDNVD